MTIIHQLAFPQSAMTHLGSEATKRYYDWLLTGPHPDAFCIGLECELTLVGFCFGGRFNAATGGFLQKNRTFLIGRVLTHPWLVFNPLFRERLTLGVTILRRLRRAQSPPPDLLVRISETLIWHLGDCHSSSLSRARGG